MARAKAETTTRLRLAVGRLARRMKQLPDETELTFSETSVLYRLAQDGSTTPTALAAAEHVRPQAMGNTLTALEKRSLVRRRPHPSDRRKLLVEILPAGRALLERRHEAVTRALEQALASGFSAAERERLAAVIPLLDRLADRL